jgi:[acyl-carrier-protein] S-malonyltransferase
LKTSYLFPGQGAQYPGMGKDLFDSSEEVRRLFSEASDIAHKNFEKLLFEGSEEELKATENTQIAVTLVNLASSQVLRERGIVPDSCAGFSLGEYSALHQAGVFSRSDVLTLVDKRGELSDWASRRLDTQDGPPGMMAVLGLDIDEVTTAIGETESVFIANHSGPNQVVLAGTEKGLATAERLLDEADAPKLVRLKVSAPFHSPLMEEARTVFSDFISGIQFSDPGIPVFANVTGLPLNNGDEVRKYCLEQLVSPVQWVACQKGLMERNPERVLETGPGTVLTGLWKTLRNGLRCKPAGTLEYIDVITE